MSHAPGVLGWDIGGVNTKGPVEAGSIVPSARVRARRFEMQHDPDALDADAPPAGGRARRPTPAAHAVTMTAELSQAFRTKREGVGFVLDARRGRVPGQPTSRSTPWTADSSLRPDARALPLSVGAANWAATARLVARIGPRLHAGRHRHHFDRHHPDRERRGRGVRAAPIPSGLLSGELVYTGALRTPAEAVAPRVPLWGGRARVSADGFALIGDAHLWLGRLGPEDYTLPTPDGRPATREFAGERLARAVCADREMLDEAATRRHRRGHSRRLRSRARGRGSSRCCSRHPHLARAVVTGLGDFIAAEAARQAGLRWCISPTGLGHAARTAPAAAVAWLLAETVGIGCDDATLGALA